MNKSYNKLTAVVVSFLFTFLVAGSALAADQGAITGPQGHFLRASKFIDKTVKNQQGQDLGKVSDVILGQDGQAQYVVISHNDKLIPVPWQAGNFQLQKNDVVASLNKSQLDQAPSFSKDNWNNLAQGNFEQKVFGYYGAGQQAPTGSMGRGYAPSQQMGPGSQYPQGGGMGTGQGQYNR